MVQWEDAVILAIGLIAIQILDLTSMTRVVQEVPGSKSIDRNH